MKGIGAAFVVLLASSGASFAAGYDDFTSGMTANLRGDYAVAVTAFTAALAAPDLLPAYKPVAYHGRAAAYLNLDRCAEGLTDVKAYEALRPNDGSVLLYRIWAELCLKDGAAAQRDFDSITKGGFDSDELFEFARTEWKFGFYEGAQLAAAKAFSLSNKYAGNVSYVLLWQALAAHRAGKFDQAAIVAEMAELKNRQWPVPILDLYIGKRTPADVFDEAGTWLRAREDVQVCQADFYVAEWHLGRGDTAAATPLLQAAVKRCVSEAIEHRAALSELKRLGMPQPEE